MEPAVNVLGGRAPLAPEVVLRRFPRTVSSRTRELPAVRPVLIANDLRSRHHNWAATRFVIIRLLVRRLKVKVNELAGRTPEIGRFCE